KPTLDESSSVIILESQNQTRWRRANRQTQGRAAYRGEERDACDVASGAGAWKVVVFREAQLALHSISHRERRKALAGGRLRASQRRKSPAPIAEGGDEERLFELSSRAGRADCDSRHGSEAGQ